MKFIKELNQADDAQPPISKSVPMIPRDKALPDDSNHLADLGGGQDDEKGGSNIHLSTIVAG